MLAKGFDSVGLNEESLRMVLWQSVRDLAFVKSVLTSSSRFQT